MEAETKEVPDTTGLERGVNIAYEALFQALEQQTYESAVRAYNVFDVFHANKKWMIEFFFGLPGERQLHYHVLPQVEFGYRAACSYKKTFERKTPPDPKFYIKNRRLLLQISSSRVLPFGEDDLNSFGEYGALLGTNREYLLLRWFSREVLGINVEGISTKVK